MSDWTGTGTAAVAATDNVGLWSVNTLADDGIAEVVQDRNAAGGTIPDRVKIACRRALIQLWVMKPWQWYRRSGTLTIVAATATADLAADFRQLDSRWVNDRSAARSNSLTFTNNARDFVAFQGRYAATDTGRPQLALVTRKQATTTSWTWQVQLTPLPDAAYSMEYVYLPACPLSLPSNAAHYKGDADLVPMPDDFARGWDLLFKQELHRKFGKPERYKMARDAWDEWYKSAVASLNKTMTDEFEPGRDGYQDMQSFMGAADVHAAHMTYPPGTV